MIHLDGYSPTWTVLMTLMLSCENQMKMRVATAMMQATIARNHDQQSFHVPATKKTKLLGFCKTASWFDVLFRIYHTNTSAGRGNTFVVYRRFWLYLREFEYITVMLAYLR